MSKYRILTLEDETNDCYQIALCEQHYAELVENQSEYLDKVVHEYDDDVLPEWLKGCNTCIHIFIDNPSC
jgi:hypothetical protein